MEKKSEQLINELIKLINGLIKKVDEQAQQIKELQDTINASTVFIDKSTIDDFISTIKKCNELTGTIDPLILPNNLKRIADKFKNHYQDNDINI